MVFNNIFSQRIISHPPALQSLRRDHMLMDMHSHTEYSHDSKTKVEDLLKRAKALGIGFAVTDHLQVKGAIEACRQKKIPVIPGIEILAKENKEIMLYFYSINDLVDYHDKYIKNSRLVEHAPKNVLRRSLVSVKCTRSMAELIEKADEYNCVKCLPHPYAYWVRGSHKMFEKNPRLMKRIDAIETINSSLSHSRNKKAAKWALRREKAFTAGSDAHTASELGRSFVAARADSIAEFLDAVRRKENFVLGSEIKRREALKNILVMNKIKRNKKW